VKNQTRNKLILLALFGLFFVPVLLAYLMNAGYIHYRPQPSKNHGNLVNPPIEMRQFSQNPLLADSNDLWKLVYVNHGPCDSDCQNSLEQGDGFYIIAPEGFLMMSYPKGFDPSGTIKDMNVLLKRKDG